MLEHSRVGRLFRRGLWTRRGDVGDTLESWERRRRRRRVGGGREGGCERERGRGRGEEEDSHRSGSGCSYPSPASHAPLSSSLPLSLPLAGRAVSHDRHVQCPHSWLHSPPTALAHQRTLETLQRPGRWAGGCAVRVFRSFLIWPSAVRKGEHCTRYSRVCCRGREVRPLSAAAAAASACAGPRPALACFSSFMAIFLLPRGVRRPSPPPHPPPPTPPSPPPPSPRLRCPPSSNHHHSPSSTDSP
ncbi:hypothetical protein OH77DRAFT_1536371 [Trametes cingulata]|nr:hypothetical protein OH77DRAFT_1536371 [Trametes cingulata]